MQKTILLSFCSTLVFFFSCKSDTAPASKVKEDAAEKNMVVETSPKSGLLSPKEFAEKLAMTDNPVLLDVRTPEEFQEGHIEKALNLDYYRNDFEAELAKLDKERPLFIYCRSGGRSGKSFDLAQKLQFKEVYDMDGGYLAWSESEK